MESVVREAKMHRLVLLLLVALLAIAMVLVGCSWFAGPASGTGGYNKIGLEIWVSRDRVSAGDRVDIRFTVDNFGNRTEIIESENGPVMDIFINTEGPAGIPRETDVQWSDGRDITPDMRRLELGPGESRTIEMTWIAEQGTGYVAHVVGGLYDDEHGQFGARVDVCAGACGLGY